MYSDDHRDTSAACVEFTFRVHSDGRRQRLAVVLVRGEDGVYRPGPRRPTGDLARFVAIQYRLDQRAGEADRLRKALAALGPRSTPSPAPKAPAREPPAARRSRARPPRAGPPTKRPRAAAANPKATAPTTKSAPASRATEVSDLRLRPVDLIG